jgi:hypothetical protein
MADAVARPCNLKENEMIYRALLTAAAIATLSAGSALATEGNDGPTCEAAAAAYHAYAKDSSDPDLKSANEQVTEGLRDCKDRKNFDEGLRKINHATARIHDHVKSE